MTEVVAEADLLAAATAAAEKLAEKPPGALTIVKQLLRRADAADRRGSRRGVVEESMIKINNYFYLTIAVAVSIGIFFVAGQISGTLNSTGLHGIAHIAAYSFLGACYAKGLPRSPMVMVTLLTAGIGGLHELYEVGRYGIGLELHDLLYDIVGAFAGALLVRQLLVLDATRER